MGNWPILHNKVADWLLTSPLAHLALVRIRRIVSSARRGSVAAIVLFRPDSPVLGAGTFWQTGPGWTHDERVLNFYVNDVPAASVTGTGRHATTPHHTSPRPPDPGAPDPNRLEPNLEQAGGDSTPPSTRSGFAQPGRHTPTR
ncbi:unnamed protein product [Protopolystoma xenopodis]|uniref:Uncharacterized protein n=1 Tax=Protopolystoma xenopodis TaxID=117903 RepID=A0A3S5AEI1_9PLAT|nr:unnamed protein product [Protopolystoma xenopodis]